MEVWKKCGENSVEVCKKMWNLAAEISTLFDINLHIKQCGNVWKCVGSVEKVWRKSVEKCGERCG